MEEEESAFVGWVVGAGGKTFVYQILVSCDHGHDALAAERAFEIAVIDAGRFGEFCA